MSRYILFGAGPNMFDAFGDATIADRLLYVSPEEIGVLNADGSKTFFKGSGFARDTNGFFIAGTIAGIVHYTNGRYTDEVRGLNVNASVLDAFFTADNFRSIFLSGDDVLDARIRAGGLVRPAMLDGWDGNDTVHGGDGADSLRGGNGNDRVTGFGGPDKLYGGLGDDALDGGSGSDRLFAWDGDDTLRGGDNSDILYGSTGNDIVSGGNGVDTLVLDTAFGLLDITKTANGFIVASADGVDRLVGIERLATDTGVYAYDPFGHAWIKISNAVGLQLIDPAAVQTGTSGDDSLTVPAGAVSAVLKGLAGNDTLSVDFDQNALVLGGAGNDSISANTGRLYGESGNDTIKGGGMVNGGNGSDRLIANFTDDTLTGGAGADTFVFSFAYVRDRDGDVVSSVSWGNDVITDFQVGTDKLQFDYDLNGVAAVPELTLTLTASGYLVTLNLDPATRSSILLEGITAPGLSVEDLIA